MRLIQSSATAALHTLALAFSLTAISMNQPCFVVSTAVAESRDVDSYLVEQQQQQQQKVSTPIYECSWFVPDDPHERVCVQHAASMSDDGGGGGGASAFTCQTRAQQIEDELQRGQPYNLGVPQRIDGSEVEKAGIREVISLMKDYFYTEVLAKEAYRDVRHKWYVSARFQIVSTVVLASIYLMDVYCSVSKQNTAKTTMIFVHSGLHWQVINETLYTCVQCFVI